MVINDHTCRPHALSRDEPPHIYWNDAFATTAQRDFVNVNTRFKDYGLPLK